MLDRLRETLPEAAYFRAGVILTGMILWMSWAALALAEEGVESDAGGDIADEMPLVAPLAEGEQIFEEEVGEPPREPAPYPGETRRPRAILIDDFGLDEAELDVIEGLDRLSGLGGAATARIEGRRGELEQEIRLTRRLADTMERQLAREGLLPEMQEVFVFEFVPTQISLAVAQAEGEQLDAAAARQLELSALLEAQRAYVRSRFDADRESSSRMEEAEQAEQSAMRMVEEAREREISERNEQIRGLLARERELAEELAAVAREEGEQLRRLSEERRQRAEVFAERRVEISDAIAALPREPREEQSQTLVDPLFDRVAEARRLARREMRDSQGAMGEARAVRREAQQSVLEALRELAEVESRLEGLEKTELGNRQRALAELRVKVHERRLQMAEDVEEAHAQKHVVFQERARFYHESLERILPGISRQRRQAFFSLRRDVNWADAVDGVGVALYNFRVMAQVRLEQVSTLSENLVSVELWSWIIGLLWRMLLFPIAFVVGRDYGPKILRRLTDMLLKRRFFRIRASLTIKVAEILRALLKPGLVYLAVYVVLEYMIIVLPEMRFPRWIVDSVFIYWVVMTVVQVLVLPRGYREQMGKSPAPDMKGFDDQSESLDALIRVVNLEISRAQKLVRSVRMVLVFWLLGRYMPEIVVQFMGHSILWWVVDQLFKLGFIGVVYYVLSAWKDEIAQVFERLAKERLPRAVKVINNHKDRPYGVLLIGAASLYVLAREVARVARAWFVDTQWSRRVSNFMFRKKIELQQREREKAHQEDALDDPCEHLPPEYVEVFADIPLTNEPYLIARDVYLERFENRHKSWLTRRRQGSVALISESGLGKTTILNQVFAQWTEEKDRDVRYVEIAEKHRHVEDIYVLLSRLFELSSVPSTQAGLIESINAQPSQVVIVDDCHHMFFRRIGGFRAMDLFLDVVNRTDGKHFWILSFNTFAWSYLNRVRNRQHYFGEVIKIAPWSEAEVRRLIRSRDAIVDIPISFTDLVVTHENEDEYYEVIKTSEGFFRLLHEFCDGNPRVALLFWLRSLKLDDKRQLQVSLFRRPPYGVLTTITDQYLFALAAVAQHGGLSAEEAATIIHADRGFCEMAMNFLHESDIITLDPRTDRARISTLYLRSVLKQLSDSNFLYE